MTTDRKTLIDQHAITVKCEFVPLSMSRKWSDGTPIIEPSINWRVTVCKGQREILTTDYMQGIGHMPGFRHGNKHKDYAEIILKACETGKYPVARAGVKDDFPPDIFGTFHRLLPFRPPSREDVLYCLLSDSDVLQYGSFEEWAGEFGYDADSRAHEAIYKQCLATALKLQSALGAVLLDKLRESFADY